MSSPQRLRRHYRTALRLLLALLLLGAQCSHRVNASTGFSSTVYYRQQSNGSIFALNSVDKSRTELERSTEYARFVGMTLHQRTGVLYWSDSRSIKRSSSSILDGSGNSNTNTQILVGALAHVTWFGVNFGNSQSDIVELLIKGTKCVSVLSWSPEMVECLVGLPYRYYSHSSASSSVNGAPMDFVKADDCRITTTSGAMQGTAPNYGEMRASGYASPIVERLEVRATPISPHALAVNDNSNSDPAGKAEEWLYWSNSADGKIYRSHLASTRIEVVLEKAWSVRGLALGKVSEPSSPASPLYFSLESPRGVALDTANQALYFTEKTGRIYKAKMLRSSVSNAVGQPASTSNDEYDSKIGPKMAARKVLTLSSMTRLDGLAVDTNMMCCFLAGFHVKVPVLVRIQLQRDRACAACIVRARSPRGRDTEFALEVDLASFGLISQNKGEWSVRWTNSFMFLSLISWPRSIALRPLDGTINSDNDDFFYSEYTGRISKGRAQTPAIDELEASNMVYLDQLVQRSSIQRSSNGDGHVHLYALE